jgi:hypothetical protein
MALLHSSNGWTANRNSLNLVDYADIELIFSSSPTETSLQGHLWLLSVDAFIFVAGITVLC